MEMEWNWGSGRGRWGRTARVHWMRVNRNQPFALICVCTTCNSIQITNRILPSPAAVRYSGLIPLLVLVLVLPLFFLFFLFFFFFLFLFLFFLVLLYLFLRNHFVNAHEVYTNSIQYGSTPAKGGVTPSLSRPNARAVLEARKAHIRTNARSGSSMTSCVRGSSCRGVAVRDREGMCMGVDGFSATACAPVNASDADAVLVTGGSRNVT
ncbi:hypothetical protein B0F90DRAFT_579279 [Multifurca ochricompacta]|uniref:Uncharacterized protein n=1 Tax=Multifurca ochricompacta TaxID=376703 RepID=A0AAD4LUJ7_9AGAM|nr:hypothetical protein B0F90DRAFT_579279 [Multifurca ochricompacta]